MIKLFFDLDNISKKEWIMERIDYIFKKHQMDYKIENAPDYMFVYINKEEKLREYYRLYPSCEFIVFSYSSTLLFSILDLSPLYFVRLDVLEEDMKKAEMVLYKHIDSKSQFVHFHTNGVYSRLNKEDIYYIEAFGHYCSLYTTQGMISVRMTLKMLLKILGKDFIQVHRCYLVNFKKVLKMDNKELQLINQRKVPIGKKYYKQLLSLFD